MIAVDAERLEAVVRHAIAAQDPEDQDAHLWPAFARGETEVFAPPGKEWVTIAVGGIRLARVHRSRLEP